MNKIGNVGGYENAKKSRNFTPIMKSDIFFYLWKFIVAKNMINATTTGYIKNIKVFEKTYGYLSVLDIILRTILPFWEVYPVYITTASTLPLFYKILDP